MSRLSILTRTCLALATLGLGLTLAGAARAQSGQAKGLPEKKEASARLLSFLKPEFDVIENGRKGVRFRFKVEVTNAKGGRLAGRIYVLGKEGKTIDAIDSDYADAEGRLCTSDEVKMDYDPGWVNYVLFLPYDAITTDPGTYNVKYCMNVWHEEGGKFIMNRPYFGSFELTVPETAGGKKGEEKGGDKGEEKGGKGTSSKDKK